MNHIANATDQALQDAVEAVLAETQSRLAPHIGVAAEHGTVTLNGTVPTETVAHAIVAATLAVDGVHSVANEINVRASHASAETATEIAIAASEALRRSDDVPHDAIEVEVSGRTVILSGTVRTPGERLAAERAITYLRGVERIDNQIVWGQAHDRVG